METILSIDAEFELIVFIRDISTKSAHPATSEFEDLGSILQIL